MGAADYGCIKTNLGVWFEPKETARQETQKRPDAADHDLLRPGHARDLVEL